jgi:hypothetical protein
VTVRFDRTDLAEMGAARTPHGVLDLPRLDLSRHRTCLHAPLGRTVVAGTSSEGGRIQVLLLTPRIVGGR